MEKISEIEKFLAEAFCIDGDCYCQGFGELRSQSVASQVIVFNLQDSKRGGFSVALSINVETQG